MLTGSMTPAKTGTVFKSYALAVDDAGRFDVYQIGVGFLPKSSGRWRGVAGPAHTRMVVSDGSYPIGLYAAELALRQSHRLDLLVTTFRQAGEFLCPHCNRMFTCAATYSDHLRLKHSDTGAAVAAWFADFPGRDCEA